jgi:plasmid stabilization system protein ParE
MVLMAEPELTSIFDMERDRAHEARLDAEAEADYAARRVVPHERVRAWFAKLAKADAVQEADVWFVRVVWTRTALRGIWRAHDYIADFNPHAAQFMLDALFAAGDGLADFPHHGRTVPGSVLREMQTVRPYVIRYRLAGEDVVILRVRHCGTGGSG